MNENTSATPAPASEAAPAAAPSTFAAAFQAAQSGGTTDTTPVEAPTPAAAPATPATSAATPATPATPAAGADAGAAPEWLKQFGDTYKSPDEIKSVLQSVEALKANQISPEQKAALRLLEDPDAYRQYADLVHTDYKALSNEEVLYREYRQQRPAMEEGAVRRLFERELGSKFPNLASGDDQDPDFLADQAAQQHEADAVRSKLTTAREQRLAEMRSNALKADGPTAEQIAESQQVHLDAVDALFKAGADGFKFSLPMPGGTPLNLAVEDADLPALREAMEKPFADLTKDDGSINHEALRQQKLWSIMGPKFVALAYQAGQEGNGAQVSVEELHNPVAGAPANPAAQPSFAQAFQQVAGQGGKAGKSIYERS